MLETVNERSEEFARTKLQRLEEMKAVRANREPELQMICDYIFPRRDFKITAEPGALRQRKLMDITGMIAHERLSATLYGYMLSPHSPWVMPRLLNREPNYEEDAWFDHVSRRMHSFYSAASNTFRVSMAEDILDLTGFGTSIMWQERTKKGPVHLAVPFRQCYWSEDENGVIDTNYRVYSMTLRRAYEKWPDNAALGQMMTDTKSPESRMVEILHVVEPRPGGRRGLPAQGLPWRDVEILTEKMSVLNVGGHSRFKYNIGRFQRRPGDPLGIGATWKTIPLCKVVSAATEAIVRNAERVADPTLATTLPRSTVIDRRPGAVNYFNQLMSFGMRDNKSLLFPIEQGGNVGVAIEMLSRWQHQIEQGMYTDWLTPGEGPQKTATEVYDLRDLRLRTMGPMVARTEHEKLNTLVETDFEDLQSVDYFDPPPASLSNEEIGFEFRGPLASSQRQGEMEGIQRTIATGAELANIDPDVVHLFRAENTMRRVADINGMDGGLLASPAEYEEKRANQRELGNMQQEMQAAQVGAQAFRDGAQGVASLQGAQGGAAA